MTESLLFILGMVLAYLFMSARFRAFIIGRPIKLQKQEVKPAKKQVITKTLKLSGGKAYIDSEETVKEWLKDNPQLKIEVK